MSKYRDMLSQEDKEIGGIIGCALDRVCKDFRSNEIETVKRFYNIHILPDKEKFIEKHTVGGLRTIIEEYIRSNYDFESVSSYF